MPRGAEFPDEEELVVCTIKSVKNFGAFVSLEEYQGKEGFIHVTEIATGWVKRMSDFVREGQRVVCKVLKVDPSKGHVDLSLKKVNDHQKREKIQVWKNEQKATKLMEFVAQRLETSVDQCYDEFGDPLVDKYGSMYAAFEAAATSQKRLKADGFDGKWTKAFMAVAGENVTPSTVEIAGILEMSCPVSNGIVHIRGALKEAENTKEENVKIQYIGAPKYRIVVLADDYKTAEEDLKKAADRAINHIKAKGGDGKFIRKEQQ
jgi:translation initiation factor 2 subunit 1